MSKVEKQSKGLPAIALRFIYFGVALALFVIFAIVLYLKITTPFSLFENFKDIVPLKYRSNTPFGTPDFVERFVNDVIDGSGDLSGEAIFCISFVMGITVYELVVVIIALVYLIILLINLIIYASTNKDKEKCFKDFRKLEHFTVRSLFILFLFDCFIKISGGIPAEGFVLELVTLALIFVGNTVFKILSQDVFGKEKFSIQNLIYVCLEMLFVLGTMIAIYFTLIKESFFGEFLTEFTFGIESGDFFDDGLTPIMMFTGYGMKIAGFFVAMSMLKPLIMYYPFDDKKGAEGSHCSTSGLLGLSIASLVIYTVANIALYSAEKYATIFDALKAGPLMLLCVLGVAITLRVAQKMNEPAKELAGEKEAAKEETKEEKPAEEVKPSVEKEEEAPAKPAEEPKKE